MKQLIFVFVAALTGLTAQAVTTQSSQVQNLPIINQRTASVASYEIVDGNSENARLRIHWVFQRGPAGSSGSIYLAYSGSENDPSMTVTENDPVQAPAPNPAMGYSAKVLTAEVSLKMLFYTQNLAGVDVGDSEKVIFRGAKVSDDNFNVDDLGVKSICVQKQASQSFAIVSCPTK